MKLSKKSRIEFEATDNYLNLLAVRLGVSESTARRYWAKNHPRLTQIGVVRLVEEHTGLREDQIVELETA